MPETQRGKQDVADFLALAQKRFQIAVDAEADWRRDGLDDLKFSIGEQWPDALRKKRERKKQPCLTLNRIPAFIKQVSNNQRQQRPAIIVNPAGDGADKELAEIFQGVVRHIEYQSDSEVADDIAFDYMLRTGKGFERVITQYEDETGDTDDQEIYIETVSNPFTVYSDPFTKKPDKSDKKWCFVVEDMSHDDYKAQYGDSALASLANMESVGNSVAGWADRETVRVAEYFYIEQTKVQGKKRAIVQQRVKWAKINAIEILEEQDWAGKIIPVVELTGDDLIVDNKRYVAGMVRDVKDSQRMYNYWNSTATETIALAPKAPFVGVKGQFNDPKWEDANTESYAYLEVDPVDVNGSPAGMPERNQYEPPIQAMVHMIAQADNDLKSITGINDASLGQRGPEQSAKAIMARQKQGDIGNLNYSDNLSRAKRVVGRILVDLIPKIYPSYKVQRIIKPDGTIDHVGIVNTQQDPNIDPSMIKEFQAIPKIYDIGVGKFDVKVSVGPSYDTKRQEAAATQVELMKNVPIVAQVAPDVVIRNMDIPGADVIADRVKRTIPPNIVGDDANTPEAQLADAQHKLTVMTQQHEQLTQIVTAQKQAIDTKQAEQSAKIEIAKIDAFKSITVAEITTKAQSGNVRAQLESDEFQMIHDGAHDVGLAAQQHAHSMAQAQQQQQAAQQTQAADQQHQAGMAQQAQEAQQPQDEAQ